MIIQGGNHAGFGDYGPQSGDKAADISAKEQQQATAGAVLAWITDMEEYNSFITGKNGTPLIEMVDREKMQWVIKPFVIDRKNFLFSNTPKGATASAVTFSIIQTAIANNLDPYAYLTYIFTEAPKMAANGEDWVEAMLPQNAPSFLQGRKEGAHPSLTLTLQAPLFFIS